MVIHIKPTIGPWKLLVPKKVQLWAWLKLHGSSQKKTSRWSIFWSPGRHFVPGVSPVFEAVASSCSSSWSEKLNCPVIWKWMKCMCGFRTEMTAIARNWWVPKCKPREIFKRFQRALGKITLAVREKLSNFKLQITKRKTMEKHIQLEKSSSYDSIFSVQYSNHKGWN